MNRQHNSLSNEECRIPCGHRPLFDSLFYLIVRVPRQPLAGHVLCKSSLQNPLRQSPKPLFSKKTDLAPCWYTKMQWEKMVTCHALSKEKNLVQFNSNIVIKGRIGRKNHKGQMSPAIQQDFSRSWAGDPLQDPSDWTLHYHYLATPSGHTSLARLGEREVEILGSHRGLPTFS